MIIMYYTVSRDMYNRDYKNCNMYIKCHGISDNDTVYTVECKDTGKPFCSVLSMHLFG